MQMRQQRGWDIARSGGRGRRKWKVLLARAVQEPHRQQEISFIVPNHTTSKEHAMFSQVGRCKNFVNSVLRQDQVASIVIEINPAEFWSG